MGIDFNEFMSDTNSKLRTYYVHGKDNIPFHTTIFPALLLGLKNGYRLPDYITSSAYVNLNNEKMSKSTGNLITANELLDMFDVDTIRFYFIFNGPEIRDTNCSLDEIIQTHNKFLVGVLGNFVNRNLSFIKKKFDGMIAEGKIEPNIREFTEKTYQLVGSLIEKGEFKNALNTIIEYISFGNKYYDAQQPWIQVKENMEAFHDTTYNCVYMIANMANLIAPIMPETSKKIKEMLHLPEFQWKVQEISGDIQLDDINLLFERIDDKKKDSILNMGEEPVDLEKITKKTR